MIYIYYILYTLYCILYSIYYILYTLYYNRIEQMKGKDSNKWSFNEFGLRPNAQICQLKAVCCSEG